MLMMTYGLRTRCMQHVAEQARSSRTDLVGPPYLALQDRVVYNAHRHGVLLHRRHVARHVARKQAARASAAVALRCPHQLLEAVASIPIAI